MKIIVAVLFILNTISIFCYSQSEIKDTMSIAKISPKLFGCNCDESPDTLSYGMAIPIDNDEFMISEFNQYIRNRYKIDPTIYSFGLLMQVAPAPKGEILKDVVVCISLNNSKEFEDLAFTLPLCALELLFLKEGTESINEELEKGFEYGKKELQVILDGLK
jgi:hypothetical protein